MGYSIYPAPSAAAKIEKTVKINSTQSWTVPADVSQIEIVLCGGGGGGGQGYDQNAGTQGSGGSGSAEKAFLSVTPGSTHTVTIGAGGAVIGYADVPTAGGTSSFGSLLSVAGGYSMSWHGNNGSSWASLSGKPGGKNGGKGARFFSRFNYGDNTSGSLFFQEAEKGIDGVGGGGGMSMPKIGSFGAGSFYNLNGSDGGGSGAFMFYSGSWQGGASSAGAANTGAGGGGGFWADAYASASNGGSGVAIIKYWSAL